MRVVGVGQGLWLVEVVFRIGEPDAKTFDRVVSSVLSQAIPIDDAVRGIADVGRAYSYDIQPPEGGAGVSLWVRADTVGGAAETGWNVASAAFSTALGATPRLWDLRVIPRDAILDDVAPRTLLTE